MTDWPESAYADLLASRRLGRAYVVVNMVASVDGAISVDGRTARLGGPADFELFHYLRSVADVILVGAETARVERYGPPTLSTQERAGRAARGQAELPRLAVVTRHGDFDHGHRVFAGGHRPVLVVPEDADPAGIDAVRGRAEVIMAGRGGVDLAAALGRLGPGIVLCEGGPTLNGQLARDDLIDELCLTVAAAMVGGGHGLLGPELLPAPLALELVSVGRRGDDVFLRYRRGNRTA